MDKEEIKRRSDQLDDLYNKTVSELDTVARKQWGIVNNLSKKTDNRNIEKVKKEIEVL